MIANTNKIQILKELETSCTLIKLRSDGIVHVHIKDKIIYGIKEQKENAEACMNFTNCTIHPYLFTLGDYVTITKEARENAKNIEKNIAMYPVAIVAENFGYKLIVDFFQKFYKPNKPLKSFSNELKAVEWLLNFSKKKSN